MKNRDFQLIIILLVLASAGLIIGRLIGTGQAPVNQAVIYVRDTEYQRVDLDHPQLLVVEQGNQRNEIQVTENSVYMHDSTCENQDCVLQGEVTLDNITQRPLGAWIICLPNQVSIELLRGETE